MAHKLISALHAKVLSFFRRLSLLDQLRHCDASKQGGREPGGAPREAFGFPHLILFFPSVPSTDKCDRARNLLILRKKFSKSQDKWSLHKTVTLSEESIIPILHLPFDRNSPIRYVSILDMGYGAMVPDVEKFRAGQKTFIKQSR